MKRNRVLVSVPWGLKKVTAREHSRYAINGSLVTPGSPAPGSSPNRNGEVFLTATDGHVCAIVSVPGKAVDVRAEIGGARTLLLKTGTLEANWPITYYLVRPLTITSETVVEVESGTVHVEFAVDR